MYGILFAFIGGLIGGHLLAVEEYDKKRAKRCGIQEGAESKGGMNDKPPAGTAPKDPPKGQGRQRCGGRR